MRLRVRLATLDDAPAVRAIYMPYVLETPISFEVDAPSAETIRVRMSRVMAAYPWLVCEFDGRVVGYAYAAPYRERAAYAWTCEVSVYVEQSMHRQGIGRVLYTALLALLRRLGYYTALAGITLPNAASVGLHESMGFRPAGVNRNVGYKGGRWWNVAYLELALGETYPDMVEPPRSIGDLSTEEREAVLSLT
jgi:L-amino acid N-acyltransferase YncA